MRPGDVIDGKYRIEAQLGEGGMGVVFAASHMAIGNTVAIKILRREALSSPEVPKRFKREAQAMGMLRSEHVIKVIDVGNLPTGEPYMVMEMLHGTDLGSRLKQGPVPAHQAVDYVMQACEGLAEAHAVGMVHRDIKPANLFVTARPNGTALVKVLDFGIATAASGSVDPRLTSTQSVMGSPSYMSPEQLKGARDVDARSDVWSLGVTLYELVTGNQPFTGNTLTALSLAIVTDAHERPINMPASMIPIIDKCLEKERERRYQNVAELAAALAPLFPGGSVAADMVRGSYSASVVPPTLVGLEASQLLGSQATMLPAPGHSAYAIGSRPSTNVTNSVGMTSTTSLASGETGTNIPAKSKKWVWLTAGIATIALGVGVGIFVGKGNGNEAVAKPPAAEQPAPPKTDPPPPPPPEEGPKTVDKQDPPKVEDPPKVDPPKDEPKVDPPKPDPKTARKPPKPPKPPKPGRPVVDPVKVDPPKPDPVKVDPPKPDPPKPDPKKQPCAPNDPRCGL